MNSCRMHEPLGRTSKHAKKYCVNMAEMRPASMLALPRLQSRLAEKGLKRPTWTAFWALVWLSVQMLNSTRVPFLRERLSFWTSSTKNSICDSFSDLPSEPNSWYVIRPLEDVCNMERLLHCTRDTHFIISSHKSQAYNCCIRVLDCSRASQCLLFQMP